MTSRHPFFCSYMILMSLAIVNTCTAIDVLKVEETWELSVGDPNVERNAPQVTMVMSPDSDAMGQYFALSLNYRSLPDYTPGG